MLAKDHRLLDGGWLQNLPGGGALRYKNLHTWLGGYAQHLGRRALDAGRELRHSRPRGPRHLLFAICDHFEPLWHQVSREVGDARVTMWEQRLPELVADLRDADGHPPRHTFFFPGEEYDPRFLDRLGRLCRRGLGEVEVHLHHDGDTADGMRGDLTAYLTRFAQHGHLSRAPSGGFQFAFIHGNWSLANARRDGRWCGVDQELTLLHQLGCYADFTFPSAPDECQPNWVNQIYWPTGDLNRRKAYDRGEPATVGRIYRDRLLMITGPLALRWHTGGGRLRPHIESAAISSDNPPTMARLRSWTAQAIHIAGCPEWIFVKLHSHGAPEKNANVMLGSAMRQLHEALAHHYNDGHRWKLHYVTAREMFNIACAAMEGMCGDPGGHRDHVIAPPPVATAAQRAA